MALTFPLEREQQLAEFLWGTKRDPFPDVVAWATERTDRYARRQWLVIDALAVEATAESIDTRNILPRWGTPIQLRGPTAKQQAWGRVELRRDGNHIIATSTNVARFTAEVSIEPRTPPAPSGQME